jgi:hypothetical protein
MPIIYETARSLQLLAADIMADVRFLAGAGIFLSAIANLAIAFCVYER